MKDILTLLNQPILVVGLGAVLKNSGRDMQAIHLKNKKELLYMLKQQAAELLILQADDIAPIFIKEVLCLQPALPILIIADDLTITTSIELYQSGVLGIVDMKYSLDELIDVIGQVLQKKIYMADDIKRFLINNHHLPVKKLASAYLTERETEIAKLILKGGHLTDIGKRLNLKTSTVSSFKRRIYNKLGITNLIELNHFLT